MVGHRRDSALAAIYPPSVAAQGGRQVIRPYLPFLAIKSSTTSGSANVLVSPIVSISSVAIFLKIRRMILPERVLGRAGAQWMTSGEAMGPIT